MFFIRSNICFLEDEVDFLSKTPCSICIIEENERKIATDVLIHEIEIRRFRFNLNVVHSY